MKTITLLMFVGALTLLTGACAPPPPPVANAAAAKAPAAAAAPAQEITITATEMAFSPTTLEVKAGQPVTLTVKNNGVLEHNWQAQIGSELVQVTAQPKQSASKTFTPQTAGTYKIICNIPGHEQAGMVAQLVVK
jgi:uncharacterized cupredoxin-like copper-binding protein